MQYFIWQAVIVSLNTEGVNSSIPFFSVQNRLPKNSPLVASHGALPTAIGLQSNILKVFQALTDGTNEERRLTVVIQGELIKTQAAGLLPNETVHILCTVVINSNGVLQRLDAGLQTEGDLGISHCVSAKDT